MGFVNGLERQATLGRGVVQPYLTSPWKVQMPSLPAGHQCRVDERDVQASDLIGVRWGVSSRNRPSLRARERAGGLITRRRRTPLVSKLDEAARWFTARRQDAGNWHMDTNGELHLIRVLSPLELAVVVDVGANLGDWSEAVLSAVPSARVTSFEPIPDVAERCADRLATFGERSQVVAVGLADTSGERAFFIDPSRTTVSGLTRPYGGPSIEQFVLPFTTGDAFCSEAGIDSIDLLKVDAEGADHLVLSGLRGMFGRGAIRIVQFEYGPWALTNRYLLADHVDFFAAFGYQVGRLYAEGVEFREHSARFEDFRLANYVAVKRTDTDAINLVSVP